MLYGANGQPVSTSIRAGRSRPEPNRDTEERVRQELKSMDSLLDIKWFPYAVHNPKYNDLEGRYGLVIQWPQADPRWAMHQSGEIEEPYDLFGWFCTDIQDADSMPVQPDMILTKVLELLGKCDNTKYPWKGRMAKVLSKNAARRDQIKKERNEQIAEMVDQQHFEHKGRTVFQQGI